MIGSPRLRDALLPDVSDQPMGSGVVTAVSKASAPWTVTVRFADGTTLAMLAAGWYDPTVNDVVLVWRHGETAVCLGAYAGAAKVVATTATLTTIAAPATPPTPPTMPTTTRTVYVSAASSATWRPSAWRADDDLYQGGDVAQRGFWFYGGAIAAAKGAGTITAASVWVPRRGTPHGAEWGNVRLGTHGFGSVPGSGATALANVVEYDGALARGGDAAVSLAAGHLAALNAGAAGLGLEPGDPGAQAADHLVVYGVSAQPATGQLALTIAG